MLTAKASGSPKANNETEYESMIKRVAYRDCRIYYTGRHGGIYVHAKPWANANAKIYYWLSDAGRRVSASVIRATGGRRRFA
jgi:hypothetical protein